MEMSGGIKEDGIVVGNAYDKYGSGNPIVKWIMDGFHTDLCSLVEKANPKTILEVGCGEGYWVVQWNKDGLSARGSDFSNQVVEIAKENATKYGLSPEIFEQRSIYDVDKERDNADLIVCCEVLEHLESPEDGLRALQEVAPEYLILSVPREPIWRILNMVRGKYLLELGNTPGHIQHWSRQKFLNVVNDYFDIVEVKTPFPWSMVLCRTKSDTGE